MPTVQLEASCDDGFDPAKTVSELETSIVRRRVTVPIYESGDVYARVRQAKQNQVGFLQQIEQIRTEQQQVLVAAWSQLETDRRNLVGAGYAVISAMGRLDAAWIGAAAYVYDPVVHYKEVRRKWLGLSITHSKGRREEFEATPVEEISPPPAK